MISVIIPIFNSEKYLYRLFRCLDNQTFTDYEILLINDGSTDESLQLCNEYARHRRNVYIYTQKNAGVSSARNYGLLKAKGEYIVFLDSDDLIPENYLMVLFQKLIEFRADISVCDVVIIKNSSEIRRFTDFPGILSRVEALNRLLSRKKINSGPCGKLFKKSIIQNIKFSDLKAYEDILFVMYVFNNANTVYVCNTSEYQYIQNDNSAMDKFQNNVSLDIITASKQIIAFINAHPELSGDCFYATLSHLYQYFEIAIQQNNREFINCAIDVFRKNRQQIIRSSYFHVKEKIVYLLASSGYFYNRKSIVKVSY